MSITLISNGISTYSAIKKLANQIEAELDYCKCSSHGFKGFKLWIKESFSHTSFASTFQWPSILLLLLCSTAFLLASLMEKSQILFVEALFLYFILIFNIFLVGFETKLRHREIHTKARLLVAKIRKFLLKKDSLIIEEWKTGKYYPHLHLPQSPCITLQWTYRDNTKVNLPTSLLVKGDIILLTPGHTAPGNCQSLEPISHSTDQNLCGGNVQSKIIELKKGEYFAPIQSKSFANYNNSRIRKSAMPMKFVLLETPYINLLRLTLDKSCNKPVTSYEKERFTIMVKYVEHLLAPFLMIICFILTFIHYWDFNDKIDEINFYDKSIMWIFLRPALVILPLLPLMTPISWTLLNAYGYAQLYLNTKNDLDNLKINRMSTGLQWSPGNHLSTNCLNNSKSKVNVCNNYDFDIESNSSPSKNSTEQFTKIDLKNLLETMKKLLLNQDENLWRSANLLQVFGSITALSCVDKKGILSTPNPSADKVFFLNTSSTSSNLEEKKYKSNQSNLNDQINNSEQEETLTDKNGIKQNSFKTSYPSKIKKRKNFTKAEVLDITPDSRTTFGLQFDDPNWKRFLPNLKPLGLAILLNTCNQEAHEEYTRFSNHISNESLLNEASVPVVNKRCLCEFARQIGFTDAATNDYGYLFQIFSFRHIKPEIIQQGKLAKSINLPQLKMSFPNMSSAIIKDNYSNSYLLFSQGSCDLILDTCSEFWNGEDLCLLSDSDKKHILDFYQRTSLTASCIAFAYVPLNKPLENIIEDQYIEFAPDSSHLFNTKKNIKNSEENKTLQSHHLSTDSLTVKDNEEQTRPKSSLSNYSIENVNLDPILNILCNQVFIGMVTLQYHASPDFVQLVETLEKACVRFVHFSKENELRSRVFSEKMGLESGWNCHISLLNDKTITCKNPICHVTNCNGSECENILKAPFMMNISDASNQNNCFLTRSQSAPSYVNVSEVSKKDESNLIKEKLNLSKSDLKEKISFSGNDIDKNDTSNSLEFDVEQKNLSNNSSSCSNFSDNITVDSSVPIAFDISNRAKLPKGIENIRPHLENVDNVPLLVSLFTDCIPETTKEMIQIMQEYGEVVCVLGSSSNLDNIPIFLQADTSIGIEPMYPQVCITIPVTQANNEIPFDEFISPIDLSNELISLPCALHFHREDTVSLSQLICYCRNFMMNVRNCLQFYLSCCLSLGIAQFCTSLLFLPPLLSPGHIIWICCFVMPILSYSLMGVPIDSQVMNMATGKNLNLSKESILYFLLCYLIKFSVSAIMIVLYFFVMITNYYNLNKHETNSTKNNYWLFMDTKDEIIAKQEVWSLYLFFCQTFASFLFVLYFVVISMGFVHRSYLIWEKSPLSNKCWFITAVLMLIINFIYCISILNFFLLPSVKISYFISFTPTYIIFISLLWPIPLVSLNGLVKRKELKIYERQQRRARLEFGTKLGMNSPF